MLTPGFIRAETTQQSYEISLHADDERVADGLLITEIEQLLCNCKILEAYPDDPRGESCLVVGFTEQQTPVHVVCGKNPDEHLIWITVYIPTFPKWKDPYKRNR